MNDYVVKVIATGPDFQYKKGWRWVKGTAKIEKEFNLSITSCALPTTFVVPA